MNVLITNVPGIDGETFPVTHQLDNSFELVFNVGGFQDLPSVFGSPDNVVLAVVRAVTELIDTTIAHK